MSQEVLARVRRGARGRHVPCRSGQRLGCVMSSWLARSARSTGQARARAGIAGTLWLWPNSMTIAAHTLPLLPSAIAATLSSTTVHNCLLGPAVGTAMRKWPPGLNVAHTRASMPTMAASSCGRARQPLLPETAVIVEQLQAVRAVGHREPEGLAAPRRLRSGGFSAAQAAALHRRLAGERAC